MWCVQYLLACELRPLVFTFVVFTENRRSRVSTATSFCFTSVIRVVANNLDSNLPSVFCDMQCLLKTLLVWTQKPIICGNTLVSEGEVNALKATIRRKYTVGRSWFCGLTWNPAYLRATEPTGLYRNASDSLQSHPLSLWKTPFIVECLVLC